MSRLESPVAGHGEIWRRFLWGPHLLTTLLRLALLGGHDGDTVLGVLRRLSLVLLRRHPPLGDRPCSAPQRSLQGHVFSR